VRICRTPTDSGRYSLPDVLQSFDIQVWHVRADTDTWWVPSIHCDMFSAVIPSAAWMRIWSPHRSSRWPAELISVLTWIPPCRWSHRFAIASETSTEGSRSRRNLQRRYAVKYVAPIFASSRIYRTVYTDRL